ncbi:MAG: hypothetical protein WCX27_02755 [Candidatus Paceibacterota bacterium]|jgi:hypothetical protein
MIKISTIFGLGILVALTPYLGFPMGGKNFIYIVSGILIVILSFLIRRELHEVLRHLHSDEVKTDTFSENAPKQDIPNS